MRLIDADRIVYSWIIDADGEEHDGVTLQSIIHKMPTIDAIEVIRCENCRKRDDKWEDWEKGKVLYWCDIMDGCVKADDYCSYAERKESG